MNDFDDQLTRREAALKAREEELAHRLRHAAAVELALAQEEQRLHTSAVLSERTEAELREVNERLVLATLGAQAMTALAEQATAQMSYMAEHDFLTELPNRSLLTDRLERAMALGRRHGTRVALMFLDLDHFKHVNDSLGHLVGDELLRLVARRLVGCVRASDTVSRQGGDEFVLLLELQHLEDASLTAQKLIKAVAAPYEVAHHRLHVTASIGISLFPDDASDVEAVMRNADTAMYQAKRDGRNRYRVFTQDLNERAVNRRSMQDALHHALEHHDFELHYQPKVNLATRAITGVEALVRLRTPSRALLAPGDFVGIAEDSGLILPIGNWVLREACRQTEQWNRQGLSPGRLAVNVSAVEFRGPDFLSGVQAALAGTGLDPQQLELELTESGLIQDTALTTELLELLKEMGVHIAVDDFGTGYSSLSYLHRFPIDTLKIDRSFVQRLEVGGEAIVSAVIAMGTSLRQRVVAEGVETEAQARFLIEHACPEGQGFLFSRPLPADGLAELLRAQAP